MWKIVKDPYARDGAHKHDPIWWVDVPIGQLTNPLQQQIDHSVQNEEPQDIEAKDELLGDVYVLDAIDSSVVSLEIMHLFSSRRLCLLFCCI